MNFPLHYYTPIATTFLSFVFAWVIYRRYRAKADKAIHLLWWSFGILIYGMGTFAESYITLFGWNPLIFKFWYIVGAILGAAPLATGTVWLLLRPRTARILSFAMIITVAISAFFVVLSPINKDAVNPNLPSGRAFAWQWTRAFSPFINTYAVICLVGGAILSAFRFKKISKSNKNNTDIAQDLFIGNSFIAAGAMMPAIGGISSRIGHTEILYIMELSGIITIWIGYWFNIRKRNIG